MSDLVVSNRQKHNDMSWSMPDSVALASITALTRNRGYKKYGFKEGNIKFKLVV